MKNSEDEFGEKLLGFGYTINDYLDHLSIISWVNYCAHKCSIGRIVTNFDERPYIDLPSGKKIVLTIMITEYEENNESPKD